MPSRRSHDDNVKPDDDRPIEPESAGVVSEAEAVRKEALDFAESVRAEAIALATGIPVKTPADEPEEDEADLEDLLIASQVVIDMCQSVLEDPELSANQRTTVEGIAEQMKTVPDSIRRAIADQDGDASAGASPGSPPYGDDTRPNQPFA